MACIRLYKINLNVSNCVSNIPANTNFILVHYPDVRCFSNPSPLPPIGSLFVYIQGSSNCNIEPSCYVYLGGCISGNHPDCPGRCAVTISSFQQITSNECRVQITEIGNNVQACISTNCQTCFTAGPIHCDVTLRECSTSQTVTFSITNCSSLSVGEVISIKGCAGCYVVQSITEHTGEPDNPILEIRTRYGQGGCEDCVAEEVVPKYEKDEYNKKYLSKMSLLDRLGCTLEEFYSKGCRLVKHAYNSMLIKRNRLLSLVNNKSISDIKIKLFDKVDYLINRIETLDNMECCRDVPCCPPCLIGFNEVFPNIGTICSRIEELYIYICPNLQLGDVTYTCNVNINNVWYQCQNIEIESITNIT